MSRGLEQFPFLSDHLNVVKDHMNVVLDHMNVVLDHLNVVDLYDHLDDITSAFGLGLRRYRAITSSCLEATFSAAG